MSQFAPTTMHGAAYAVAIEVVGGVNVIGACDTDEKYAELRAKLDHLLAFARTQEANVFLAYKWGIDKVDGDIKGRLSLHENARQVSAALAKLPRPPSIEA